MTIIARFVIGIGHKFSSSKNTDLIMVGLIYLLLFIVFHLKTDPYFGMSDFTA